MLVEYVGNGQATSTWYLGVTSEHLSVASGWQPVQDMLTLMTAVVHVRVETVAKTPLGRGRGKQPVYTNCTYVCFFCSGCLL
jgi:hypothetical protein